jgi:hypothetical protein
MRVKASLQFSCATTGRSLETQLITDTRNFVIFRRGTVAMRCEFCGRRHYWKLIEYHRPHIKDMKRRPRPSRASRVVSRLICSDAKATQGT